MGGHLWGSLALLCICFLVVMRVDAENRAPWDKEQLIRKSPPSPTMGHWTPQAQKVKVKHKENDPSGATGKMSSPLLVPVEKKGSTRMKRDGVYLKDNHKNKTGSRSMTIKTNTTVTEPSTTASTRTTRDVEVLESMLATTEPNITVTLPSSVFTSWILPNTMEPLETSTTTEPTTVVTTPSSTVTTCTSGHTEPSGDTSATTGTTTTLTIPTSTVTTWTSGSTEDYGDTSATTEPSSTVSTLSSRPTSDVTRPAITSSSPGPTVPTSPSGPGASTSGHTTPMATTTSTTVTTPTTTSTTTSTPTTNSTTMTTMASTTNVGHCQNGATWDGTKCLCLEGYYGEQCEIPICENNGTMVDGVCRCTDNFQGDYCEYAKEVIEIKDTTVNATVEMKTKIDNRKFTEELNDKSSPAFKDFETDFKNTMAKVYQDVKGYQGVEIHDLTRGSIVVNYTVLLEVPANTAANQTVKSISKNLVEAVQNNSVCDSSCEGDNCSFCFNQNFTSVTNYGVGEVKTDLCANHVVQELSDYYTPFVTDTGVLCITKCDKRAKDPHTCIHGRCTVTRSGPQCECSDQVAFWYQDDICSSRISKMGVAIGVLVTLLVVATVIFTIFLVRARRKEDEHRLKLATYSEVYGDEEESWSNNEGFAITNPAATLEGSETYSSNYISLEKLDTSQKIQRPFIFVS